MDIVLRERRDQGFVAGDVREDAQLDLGVIGDDDCRPGGAMKARRISAAAAVRIEDVLQVRVGRREAARRGDVCRKEVWTRPASSARAGSASTYVPFKLGDLAELERQARDQDSPCPRDRTGPRRPSRKSRLRRLFRRGVSSFSKKGSVRA